MGQMGSYGTHIEMLTLSHLLLCNVNSFDAVASNWQTLVRLIRTFLKMLKENQCIFTGRMEIILML